MSIAPRTASAARRTFRREVEDAACVALQSQDRSSGAAALDEAADIAGKQSGDTAPVP